MRAIPRLSVLTLAVAIAGAAPIAPAQGASQQEIRIDNFTFAPQALTIPKGATVVWVNRDDTPHRIVAVENQFKSPVLDTDEKFARTFNETGSFAYFCSLHPHMTGTITVTGN